MAVFCLSKLDAYFLTTIAGIDNTERVASDFSNDMDNAVGWNFSCVRTSDCVCKLQLVVVESSIVVDPKD